MREIKFRAWDKDVKNTNVKRVDFDNVARYAELWCLIAMKPALKLYGDERDEFVLMQYVGLKDKNGREIYEASATFTRIRSCATELVQGYNVPCTVYAVV